MPPEKDLGKCRKAGCAGTGQRTGETLPPVCNAGDADQRGAGEYGARHSQHCDYARSADSRG